MSLKTYLQDNLFRSPTAAKVIGKYHSWQDEILSDRQIRIQGTAIRRAEDYWNYITHAAFHQLEGWPPRPPSGAPERLPGSSAAGGHYVSADDIPIGCPLITIRSFCLMFPNPFIASQSLNYPEASLDSKPPA